MFSSKFNKDNHKLNEYSMHRAWCISISSTPRVHGIGLSCARMLHVICISTPPMVRGLGVSSRRALSTEQAFSQHTYGAWNRSFLSTHGYHSQFHSCSWVVITCKNKYDNLSHNYMISFMVHGIDIASTQCLEFKIVLKLPF